MYLPHAKLLNPLAFNAFRVACHDKRRSTKRRAVRFNIGKWWHVACNPPKWISSNWCPSYGRQGVSNFMCRCLVSDMQDQHVGRIVSVLLDTTCSIDFVINFSVGVTMKWDHNEAYVGTPCFTPGLCVPNSGQCGRHLYGQPIGIMGAQRFSRKGSCGTGHRHMLQDSRINTRHQGALLQSRWGVLASFSGLGAYGKCLGHLGLPPVVKKLRGRATLLLS